MGGGSSKGGGGNAPPDSEMRKIAGPWTPLTQPLQGTIGDIRYLNANSDPWSYGPNVTQPWNEAQQAGYQSGTGIAMAGDPAFGAATGFVGDAASGRNVGAAPGSQFLASLASQGPHSPVTGMYADIAQRAQQPSGGTDYLRGAAGGRYLGSNPYLDSTIHNAMGDITREYTSSVVPQLEGRMSQSGMLGSSVEQGLQGDAQRGLVDRLGSVETSMRLGDYQNERGLQQQAGMALPGAQATEVGTALAGAGGQAGDYWQQLQAQLTGAQAAGSGYRSDIGQGLQAAGALGNVYESQFAPTQELMNLGGMAQQQAQQQAAEAHQAFQYNQQAPWQQIATKLGLYGQIAGMTNPGMAGQYAAQQMSQPSGSPWGTVAGLAGLAGGIMLAPYTGGASMAMAGPAMNQLYRGY